MCQNKIKGIVDLCENILDRRSAIDEYDEDRLILLFYYYSLLLLLEPSSYPFVIKKGNKTIGTVAS
jgi:hypothetical protein